MSDRNLPVKRRKRRSERCGGIPLNENQIRFYFRKDRVHPVQDPPGHADQRLLLLHDAEITVRLKPENLHDGSRKIPMLAAAYYAAVNHLR